MIILGINAYHWDSSVALVVDGNLIGASEEERFNRIKHFNGLPIESLIWLLDKSNIKFCEVDYICVPTDPTENLKEKLFKANFSKLWTGWARHKKKVNMVSRILDELKTRDRIDLIGEGGHFPKVYNVEHHNAHIYSAVIPSGYEECAYLTLDAFGDYNSSKIGFYKNNRLITLRKTTFPYSIGIFYTALTQYLGFENVGDEYKVMGLSPYGDETFFSEKMDKLISFKDGSFKMDLKYFNHLSGVEMNTVSGVNDLGLLYTLDLNSLLGLPPRLKNEELLQCHMDLAAAVQKKTERLIIEAVRFTHNLTGLNKIVISGGVGQNSVANGKIIENSGFDDLFIPTAAHDAGLSIGAALGFLVERKLSIHSDTFKSAFLGYSATDNDIEILINKCSHRIEYYEYDALIARVAQLLKDGLVLGWFQGSAEFGPRALGNRSILTNPARKDAKEIINRKIKRRESFRPFAPSILSELQHEWFQSAQSSIYMERVLMFRNDKIDKVPAVVHVDNSGRVQTVTRDSNAKYYDLISKFYEITGVPMLLNTSFNENEPIVNTPIEAYHCFERTDMDVLVVNDMIIYK